MTHGYQVESFRSRSSRKFSSLSSGPQLSSQRAWSPQRAAESACRGASSMSAERKLGGLAFGTSQASAALIPWVVSELMWSFCDSLLAHLFGAKKWPVTSKIETRPGTRARDQGTPSCGASRRTSFRKPRESERPEERASEEEKTPGFKIRASVGFEMLHKHQKHPDPRFRISKKGSSTCFYVPEGRPFS